MCFIIIFFIEPCSISYNGDGGLLRSFENPGFTQNSCCTVHDFIPSMTQGEIVSLIYLFWFMTNHFSPPMIKNKQTKKKAKPQILRAQQAGGIIPSWDVLSHWCSSGNSCHLPLGHKMTTSSLPLLCFFLFNYPQLSLGLFVSPGWKSKTGRKKKKQQQKLIAFLPRCMQIFAQTPLSWWEMW